jgi:hypothetical protein
MRVLSILVMALLFGLATVPAQEDGKLIKETWDALYVGGAKAGIAHTTIREIKHDGKPLLVTSLDTSIQVKRYEDVVTMAMSQTCEETPEGKVRGLGSVLKLDKGEVRQFGKVEGDKIRIKIGNNPNPVALPWQDDVIGLAKQERMWADQKLKPGLVVRYKNFDPAVGAAVNLTATVQEKEDALVLEDVGTAEKPKSSQVRKSLWRILLTAEPVQIGPNKIPLPDQTLWVDDNGHILRSEFDFPGLGRMTTLRVNKGLASLKDAVPAEMPDLGLNTLVKLGKAIPRAHDASKIVYRITVKEEKNAATTFAQDARQKVGAVKGDTFELTIKPVREPADVGIPAPADEDFLRPTQMLDSGDERIVEVAKKVTAGVADPWARARKIESWVHDNMHGTTAIGLVKASQVCTDLKGDCRQHAMLTAALCRAAGVPARTAQGLVYVDDRKNGPLLGFHMWTEVWVKGQWLGIDAVFGKGSIGAGHLKISDSAWKDGEGLAPLLSLVRVLGRLNIEVVSVE